MNNEWEEKWAEKRIEKWAKKHIMVLL